MVNPFFWGHPGLAEPSSNDAGQSNTAPNPKPTSGASTRTSGRPPFPVVGEAPAISAGPTPRIHRFKGLKNSTNKESVIRNQAQGREDVDRFRSIAKSRI